MEHKERNNQIRQKILGEIADIEAFSRQRECPFCSCGLACVVDPRFVDIVYDQSAYTPS